MTHWLFKQTIAVDLLKYERNNRSTSINQSSSTGSSLSTSLFSDEVNDVETTSQQPNSLYKRIQEDHRLDKILKKRRTCVWKLDNENRCANKTYSCCRSCKLSNEPYLLCGVHIVNHHELEYQLLLQQIN